MQVAPARRKMVIARLRRLAMMRGAAGGADLGAVFIEVVVADPVWSRPSIAQWPRMLVASSAGLAWVMVSEVTA
jgi:hypothetical protein